MLNKDKLTNKCKQLDNTVHVGDDTDINGDEFFSDCKVLPKLFPANVKMAAGVFKVHEYNSESLSKCFHYLQAIT